MALAFRDWKSVPMNIDAIICYRRVSLKITITFSHMEILFANHMSYPLG